MPFSTLDLSLGDGLAEIAIEHRSPRRMQATTDAGQFTDRVRPLKRRRNRPLSGHVAAQAHRREQVEATQQFLDASLRTCH